MKSLIENINLEKVPSHIAIIMDGNGRWAKENNQERFNGHIQGVESVRRALKAATNLGVKYLTLYAFSTENWNRPKDEVDALMDLLIKTIASEVDELNTNEVRLGAIGNLSELPNDCEQVLNEAISKTSQNSKIELILALSYGSRNEITNAVKHISNKVKSGEIKSGDIDENTIKDHLYTSKYPDPELLIRTSGETRVSNFLLWQIAYSEFCFLEKYWPDFQEEDLYQAVFNFQNTERRFGKISEQINS